ncbi:MAG: hypothetical protein KC619_07115 [Myxococcales bacterium]|nr:hypothetical protein [Myxococcales bacterium]
MSRIALLAALLLGSCGGESEGATPSEPATSTASTEEPAPTAPAVDAPPPAHGGTVVAVGPHFLEVVAQGDGVVVAWVHERSAPLPAGSRVTVRVTADDGGQHPVLLVWDPAASSYRGRLYRVGAIPGPIRVTLATGDTTLVGEASTVVVTSPPEEVARPATPRTGPTESGAGETEPVATATPEPEEPETPAPSTDPPPSTPDPEPVAPIVRPAVVATPRPVVGPSVVGPRPTGSAAAPVPRTPIVDRRGRATATPRQSRETTSEQATVRVRE